VRYILILILILFFSINAFALEIKSSAFEDGEYIPDKYACTSIDVSPPLEWSDVPEGTKSFVIICDDPDAPVGTWVHWVIFNIPAEKNSLEENMPNKDTLADGTYQGINDFKKVGYGGPCPPLGKPHRYFFKLYALDIRLESEVSGIPNKRDIESDMKGHILDQVQLIGLYKR